MKPDCASSLLLSTANQQVERDCEDRLVSFLTLNRRSKRLAGRDRVINLIAATTRATGFKVHSEMYRQSDRDRTIALEKEFAIDKLCPENCPENFMATETLRSSQGRFGPRTRRLWAVRILRGMLRRLADPTRLMVLRASPNDLGWACPEGCAFVRISGKASASAARLDLAREAMRAAGEPIGLEAPRLANGDEFFGWLMGGRVVSFGWVTFQGRAIGPIQLAKASGRAFLYNFHTLDGYRGRQLYPALLLAIRHVLGREKVAEFVIDSDVRNTASAKGIEKGGFVLVARVAYLTLFARWRCLGSRTLLEPRASSLFRCV